MSKNKQCPEHCPLGSPVQWPNQPAVRVNGSHCQPKHHNNIPEDITHRLPWILDPAMLGNRSSNISNPERRWRTGIKSIPSTNPISSFTSCPLPTERVLFVCKTKKEDYCVTLQSQKIETQAFKTISGEKQTSLKLPCMSKPLKI